MALYHHHHHRQRTPPSLQLFSSSVFGFFVVCAVCAFVAVCVVGAFVANVAVIFDGVISVAISYTAVVGTLPDAVREFASSAVLVPTFIMLLCSPSAWLFVGNVYGLVKGGSWKSMLVHVLGVLLPVLCVIVGGDDEFTWLTNMVGVVLMLSRWLLSRPSFSPKIESTKSEQRRRVRRQVRSRRAALLRRSPPPRRRTSDPTNKKKSRKRNCKEDLQELDVSLSSPPKLSLFDLVVCFLVLGTIAIIAEAAVAGITAGLAFIVLLVHPPWLASCARFLARIVVAMALPIALPPLSFAVQLVALFPCWVHLVFLAAAPAAVILLFYLVTFVSAAVAAALVFYAWHALGLYVRLCLFLPFANFVVGSSSTGGGDRAGQGDVSNAGGEPLLIPVDDWCGRVDDAFVRAFFTRESVTRSCEYDTDDGGSTGELVADTDRTGPAGFLPFANFVVGSSSTGGGDRSGQGDVSNAGGEALLIPVDDGCGRVNDAFVRAFFKLESVTKSCEYDTDDGGSAGELVADKDRTRRHHERVMVGGTDAPSSSVDANSSINAHVDFHGSTQALTSDNAHSSAGHAGVASPSTYTSTSCCGLMRTDPKRLEPERKWHADSESDELDGGEAGGYPRCAYVDR